jgi:hypothetical protein
MSHLKGAGSLVKIIGAPAVLNQNLPLPCRANIIDTFSDGDLIAVDRGAIIIRGSGQ